MKEITSDYIFDETRKVNELTKNLNKEKEDFYKELNGKKLQLEEDKKNIQKETGDIQLEIAKLNQANELKEININNEKTKLKNESELKIAKIKEDAQKLMYEKEEKIKQIENHKELALNTLKFEKEAKLGGMEFSTEEEKLKIINENAEKKIIWNKKKRIMIMRREI